MAISAKRVLLFSRESVGLRVEPRVATDDSQHQPADHAQRHQSVFADLHGAPADSPVGEVDRRIDGFTFGFVGLGIGLSDAGSRPGGRVVQRAGSA